MEFKIKLSIEEARNIKTFINRTIYEQYERNMKDCYSTKAENDNRIADTIIAFEELRDQLQKQMLNRKKELKND